MPEMIFSLIHKLYLKYPRYLDLFYKYFIRKYFLREKIKKDNIEDIEEEYNKEKHEILVEEIVEEAGKRYGIGYTKEYIKKKVIL